MKSSLSSLIRCDIDCPNVIIDIETINVKIFAEKYAIILVMVSDKDPTQKKECASPKEERILSAAQEVFSRYGYARTTMADVAAAAHMSRPALYLVFPGKEELFSAVIRRMNTAALKDIHAGLAACGTLEEKLRFALDRWMAQAYDLAYASPDAEDLFRYSYPAMREVSEGFQAFLADLLRDAAAASSLNVTPEDLAQALFFSVHGFKTVAANGTDLRRMIALQVGVVVAALKE